MVHSHCSTPNQRQTETSEMGTKHCGNLCLCLSLCILKTSTQFYTKLLIFIGLSIDIWQCEHTIRVGNPGQTMWNSKLTTFITGGQRFFAKAKLAAASQATPPATPTTPTRPQVAHVPPSGQGSPAVRQRHHRQQDQGEYPPQQGMGYHPSSLTSGITSQPQENFNTGYLDQSMDRDSFGPRSTSNPLFSERSPTGRPPIPFQGQHYDIYSSPSTETPPRDMRDTVL